MSRDSKVGDSKNQLPIIFEMLGMSQFRQKTAECEALLSDVMECRFGEKLWFVKGCTTLHIPG
ncbi:hypothetical protein AD935_06515 [Gluconobacter japonicus]|nr:hypothetical protein AD935_06515 [Gluconobacter japonicus]